MQTSKLGLALARTAMTSRSYSVTGKSSYKSMNIQEIFMGMIYEEVKGHLGAVGDGGYVIHNFFYRIAPIAPYYIFASHYRIQVWEIWWPNSKWLVNKTHKHHNWFTYMSIKLFCVVTALYWCNLKGQWSQNSYWTALNTKRTVLLV